MLQSMKHRGPDSTGYALYGKEGPGVLMRYKLADANSPRDFDYLDRLARHQREITSRIELAGATILHAGSAGVSGTVRHPRTSASRTSFGSARR